MPEYCPEEYYERYPPAAQIPLAPLLGSPKYTKGRVRARWGGSTLVFRIFNAYKNVLCVYKSTRVS